MTENRAALCLSQNWCTQYCCRSSRRSLAQVGRKLRTTINIRERPSATNRTWLPDEDTDVESLNKRHARASDFGA